MRFDARGPRQAMVGVARGLKGKGECSGENSLASVDYPFRCSVARLTGFWGQLLAALDASRVCFQRCEARERRTQDISAVEQAVLFGKGSSVTGFVPSGWPVRAQSG
jgi:hypothetical protein